MWASAQAGIGSMPQSQVVELDVDPEVDIPEIDIAWSLVTIATEGLHAMKGAIDKVGVRNLWDELPGVSQTLEALTTTAYNDQFEGDGLEQHAAFALGLIDEMLRKELARELVLLLQRHMQDLAVLLCGRFLNHDVLRMQGIAPKLKARLELAFPFGTLRDDLFWSPLGNAK